MLLKIILLVALVAATGQELYGQGSQGQSQARDRPSFVKVDGKTNPEKIPEYALWNSIFTMMQTLPREWFRTQLQLTRAEEDLLYAEGKAQTDRDAACAKRMERMLATVSPADQNRVWWWEENMACRQADLDAADALLVKFSPETRARVVAWVETKRATISIYIDKRNLDTFGMPR